MFVENIMKKVVITLPPSASIHEALQLLQKHHIRHIPITNAENHVIGIVSDRDLSDASPSIFDKVSNQIELKNEIQSIISQPVVTVHPLDFVDEIAQIFYDEGFAAVPVVSNNKLVGIITEKDLLNTLIQLTGTHVQSSHIQVKVQDRHGVLPEITAFFGKRKINIISLLIYPYKEDPHYKVLMIRFQTMNPSTIIGDLRNAGFDLMWPNNMQEPSL